MTWHREPLVHFLLIGAIMFGVFALVNDEADSYGMKRIVVTAGDIERIQEGWAKQWHRQPTETELNGLINSHIREEVLYREGLALGLDQNDTIIRRRLMQKMEFLSNDLAELNPPDESTLNQYFLDNQEKYQLPAQVSFTHIYFSRDKRGARAVEDAEKLKSELKDMRAPDEGDNIMLPRDFEKETPFEVERLFGKGFADQLFQSEINGWEGPIESGYGLHLVWISEKIDSRMPELASVINKVRTDWMFQQRQKMNKDIYETFKARYEIVIENMPQEPGVAKAAALDKGT